MLVLVNARSGRLPPERKAAVLRDAFERHGLRPELRLLRHASMLPDAIAAGLRDGAETIVVGGGDGTLSAAAGCLADTGRRMGVLPMGTFNYFARGLGIPADTASAVALLAHGQERRIAIGEVNGKVFLNNASLGVYSRILEQRELLYRRWGRSQLLAHLSVVLSLLRLRSSLSIQVTVDRTVVRRCTPMVFVANNAFQLAEFGLAGAECLERGHFALYVAPDCGRLALLGLAARLLAGRLRPARHFELLSGREVVVETRRRTRHLVRDGERSRVPGPYHFRLRPGALRVIAPAPAG